VKNNRQQLKHINLSKRAFTLIEIIISMLVFAITVTSIFSGFDVIQKLERHADFESESAFLAERELELAKAKILTGSLKAEQNTLKSAFPLKPHWELTLHISKPDKNGLIELSALVESQDRQTEVKTFLALESRKANQDSLGASS